MKRHLRLVKADHKERGFWSFFLGGIAWFLRNEGPEILSRILVYGWSAIWIVALVRFSNLETMPDFVLMVLGLIYALSCGIMLEGLYFICDRNSISIGRVRHILIPALAVLCPVTLCVLVLALLHYILWLWPVRLKIQK